MRNTTKPFPLGEGSSHDHIKSVIRCLFLRSLLVGLLIINFACDSSLESDYYDTLPQTNAYIVEGTVYISDIPTFNQSVWLFIQDYKYSRWQTSFECKTDYNGRYKFIVDYKPWDNYPCDVYMSGSSFIRKTIRFGCVDEINFNL